jgi:fibronectin-binding autotransporter adhesin
MTLWRDLAHTVRGHSALKRKAKTAGLIALAAAGAISALSRQAHAATFSYDGGSFANGDWSNASNWSTAGGNTAPTTINNSGSFTFGGTSELSSIDNISGLTATSITFSAGAGAFTVSATGGDSLTLSGNITDNATNNEILSLPLILSAPVTVTNTGTGTLTLSGAISGSGESLTFSGGTVDLISSSNTFTGGVDVTAGTLVINADADLGTGGGVTLGGGALDTTATMTSTRTITLGTGTDTFDVASTTTLTENGAIGGTGGLTMATGTGTLVLGDSSNAYGGGTTLNAGILSISNDGDLGASTGGLTFGGGTLDATATMTSSRTITLNTGTNTFDVASAQTLTENGAIGGTGGLTMATGTGTLVLGDSSNNYSGNTTINAGTLSIGANSDLGTTGTIALGGGTLNTTATFSMSRNVTLNTGTDTFNVASGTTLTESGLFSGTGALTMATGTGTLNLSDASNTYSGGTTISAGTLQLGATNAIPGGTGKGDVSVGGTLDLNAFSETINGLTGAGTVDTVAGGTPTLTIGSNGDGGTFSGVIQNTSGTLALTKTGAGTEILSGLNTFAGGTTISGGILEISADSGLGTSTGTLAIGGGTLETTATMSSSRAITLNTGTDTFNVASGTILTENGLISGTGGLTMATGTGTLNLSDASNSYSGTTTISAGTLQLGALGVIPSGTGKGDVSVAGTLDLNTFSETINGLSGAGTVNTVAGGTPTFTIGSNGDGGTFSGVIKNTAGTLSLVKTGAGTQVLSGINTFSGGTTISGGILEISADSGLGATAGTLAIGGGTLETSATFSSSRAITLNTGTDTFDVATPTTLTEAGLIGGTGGLTMATGTGTLVLSDSSNGYSGGTTLNAGTLSIGADADMGTGGLTMGGGTLDTTATMSSSRAITLNTGTNTFDVASATTLTENGLISGTGGLTMATGAGTLVLSDSSNSYVGTTLDAGTLSIGADADMGTGGLTMAGGTLNTTATFSSSRAITLGTGTNTFNVASGTTLTEAGLISGTGALTMATGTGTLILSDSNTFSGGVTLSAGTLNINNNNAIGSGTFVVNGGTTFDNTSAGSITLSHNNNAQTWNGNFTFTGSNPLSFGTGAATVNATTTATISNSTLTVGSITYTHALTETGAGELIISNSGTGTGGMTINGTVLSNSAAGADSPFGSAATLTIGSGATLIGGVQDAFGYVQTENNDAPTTYDINGGTVTDQASTPGYRITLANITFGNTGGSLTAVTGNAGDTDGNYSLFGNGTTETITTGSAPTSTAVITGGTISIQTPTTIDTTAAGTIASGPYPGVDLAITSNIENFDVNTLTKSGTGVLLLSGNNTFTAGLILSAGQLDINSATALGTGAYTINGTVSMDNTSGNAITLTNNNAQSWDTGFTFVGSNNLNMGTGAITLHASPTITVSAGLLTEGGVISGTADSITKAGAGSLLLSGNDTYTGTTADDAGTLYIDGATTGQGNYSIPNTITASTTLGGTGSIGLGTNDTLTLTGKSSGILAILSPGDPNTSMATLTVGTSGHTNTVTFAADSEFAVGVNGASNDELVVNGTLNTASSSNVLALNLGTLTQGSYTLATYTSLTDTGNTTLPYGGFSSATGLTNSAYHLEIKTGQIDLAHYETIGTISATPTYSSIITGATDPFTYTVQNSAPTGSDSMTWSTSNVSNVTGSSNGGPIAGGATSGSISGLTFNGSTPGLAQTGTFQVNDSTSTNTGQQGTVTVNVLDHASGSATVTAGNNFNAFVNSTLAATVNLAAAATDLTGASDAGLNVGGTSANLSGGTIGVIAAGSSSNYSASFNTGSTAGALNVPVSFNTGDDPNIHGASAVVNGNVSTTISGSVYDHAAIASQTVTPTVTQGQTVDYNYSLSNPVNGSALRDTAAVSGVSADGNGYTSGFTGPVSVGSGASSASYTGTFTASASSASSMTYNFTYGDQDTYQGYNNNNQTATLTVTPTVYSLAEVVPDNTNANADGRSMAVGTNNGSNPEAGGSTNNSTLYITMNPDGSYSSGSLMSLNNGNGVSSGYVNMQADDQNGNPCTFNTDPNLLLSFAPGSNLTNLEADLTAFDYTWYDASGNYSTGNGQESTGNTGLLAGSPFSLELVLPYTGSGSDPVFDFDFSNPNYGNLMVTGMETLGISGPVPEPAAGMILTMAATGVLLRRRRRTI